MKIRIEGGEPVSADVVLNIERVLGARLSEAIGPFSFYVTARSLRATASISAQRTGSGVRRFIRPAEILRQRE